MKLVDGPKLRHLKDVSYEELQHAVIEMCKSLSISGSYAGSFEPQYSLYDAVHHEKEKVMSKKKGGIEKI